MYHILACTFATFINTREERENKCFQNEFLRVVPIETYDVKA